MDVAHVCGRLHARAGTSFTVCSRHVKHVYGSASGTYRLLLTHACRPRCGRPTACVVGGVACMTCYAHGRCTTSTCACWRQCVAASTCRHHRTSSVCAVTVSRVRPPSYRRLCAVDTAYPLTHGYCRTLCALLHACDVVGGGVYTRGVCMSFGCGNACRNLHARVRARRSLSLT